MGAQEEVEQKIMGMFFKPERKSKIFRHRCLDCGKRSVNVFCRECRQKRWDAAHKEVKV